MNITKFIHHNQLSGFKYQMFKKKTIFNLQISLAIKYNIKWSTYMHEIVKYNQVHQ